MRHEVLVVDDDSMVSEAMCSVLADHGYAVRSAATAAEAVSSLCQDRVSLVFTDLKLPDATGIELLTRIRQESPAPEVILMTAHGSVEVTVEAIKRGAFYYIEKPFTPDQLIMLTERALECVSIKNENEALKKALVAEDETFGMVGTGPAMRQIYEVINVTASSDASVLVEGESGTGKELIATAIHANSSRADRPFVRINCAAIPRELIESELFGYRRGAFTGATHDKRGLMEAASAGTLHLDEIAEMPCHLQAKLLRALQERRLRRLGDEREIDVDFRLISATNRDSEQAVKDGDLRADLYYRISTIKIKVPPLRDRLEDIPLLVDHFLRRYSRKYDKQISKVSEHVYHALTVYAWPGNVRELESVIERAVLFSRDAVLTVESLPAHVQGGRADGYRCSISPYMSLEEIEREAIIQTLERAGGNIKKTAELLRVHRPTLYRKLRRFGIRVSEDIHPACDSQTPMTNGETRANPPKPPGAALAKVL